MRSAAVRKPLVVICPDENDTKTVKLVTILLGLSLTTFGQNKVEIKGTVFALQLYTNDTLRLKNAEILLEFSDSSSINTLTNERGEYKFLVTESKRPQKIYAKSTSQTFNKTKRQYCFMADGSSRLIPTTHNTIFIVDFKFRQFTDCGPVPPELTFKLNSFEFNDQKDSVNYLVSVMREYPLMKIEVQGHADVQERRPQKLSKNRARQVYNELIKSGIDNNRVTYKGFGDKTPLISEQIIVKAASDEEKKALRQKNTRVTFKILEFGIE
jgi:outer membrane protein OmpA-like peptidoglycan-associated protein